MFMERKSERGRNEPLGGPAPEVGTGQHVGPVAYLPELSAPRALVAVLTPGDRGRAVRAGESPMLSLLGKEANSDYH